VHLLQTNKVGPPNKIPRSATECSRYLCYSRVSYWCRKFLLESGKEHFSLSPPFLTSDILEVA